ncbi:MAG: 2,3-bisphosphoglycerate-independent phosphoglycerate mutase [Thermodesulfobacteriota bacterium]
MRYIEPVLLLILDGWGHAPEGPGNAIYAARTPNLDWVQENYPCSLLECSGQAVGLPQGQMGNSEVGHLNIGAGRIVYQDILRIDQAVADAQLGSNPVLQEVMHKVKARGSCLHLLGLLSDGGVHSHFRHLLALLQAAREFGLEDVCVHAFLDGRDTSPWAGAGFVRRLKQEMQDLGLGRIGTLCGRYYAMDRDKHWSRTKAAYKALVLGAGEPFQDPLQAVEARYEQSISDEFIPPTQIVDKNGQPEGLLQDGDGLFFFNFRADRARQMASALSREDFSGFERGRVPKLCALASMTEYEPDLDLEVAFPPVSLEKIMGQVCSEQGLKQLRLAETEKYAHVTYFFNGGQEEAFALEDRVLVPSPREVATYDQKPEMSLFQVWEELATAWKSGVYSFVVCNFANLDMVGHTGNFNAAVQACEAVDSCVGQVLKLILSGPGTLVLTADHGNAEYMLSQEQKPHTAHTQNPVPFFLLRDQGQNCRLRSQGILADIAPTILDLWTMPKPGEMTGSSLLQIGGANG